MFPLRFGVLLSVEFVEFVELSIKFTTETTTFVSVKVDLLDGDEKLLDGDEKLLDGDEKLLDGDEKLLGITNCVISENFWCSNILK